MASPVGHTLAGLCLAAAAPRGLLRTPAAAAALLLAANLPDFDHLPQLFLGAAARDLHQGFTHSAVFTLLAAVPLALPFRRTAGLLRGWALLALVGAAHLLLDFVAVDEHPPVGIPLLWPFLPTRWHSPVDLLPPLDKSSFLNLGNFTALGAELAWFLPLLWVLLRRRSAPGAAATGARSPLPVRGPGGGPR